MTDRIAFFLALTIALAIGADVLLNDSRAVLFMLRKLLDLIAYVSIWR